MRQQQPYHWGQPPISYQQPPPPYYGYEGDGYDDHQSRPPVQPRQRASVGASDGFAAIVAFIAVGGAIYFAYDEGRKGEDGDDPPPPKYVTLPYGGWLPDRRPPERPKNDKPPSVFSGPLFIGLCIFLALCAIGYLVSRRLTASKRAGLINAVRTGAPKQQGIDFMESARAYIGTSEACWRGISWGLTLVTLLLCGTFLQDQGQGSLAAMLYIMALALYIAYISWHYYRQGRNGMWKPSDSFWFFFPVLIVLGTAEITGGLGYQSTRKTLHVMALVILALWLSVVTALPRGKAKARLRNETTLAEKRGIVAYWASRAMGTLMNATVEEQEELTKQVLHDGTFAGAQYSASEAWQKVWTYFAGTGEEVAEEVEGAIKVK